MQVYREQCEVCDRDEHLHTKIRNRFIVVNAKSSAVCGVCSAEQHGDINRNIQVKKGKEKGIIKE